LTLALPLLAWPSPFVLELRRQYWWGYWTSQCRRATGAEDCPNRVRCIQQVGVGSAVWRRSSTTLIPLLFVLICFLNVPLSHVFKPCIQYEKNHYPTPIVLLHLPGCPHILLPTFSLSCMLEIIPFTLLGNGRLLHPYHLEELGWVLVAGV